MRVALTDTESPGSLSLSLETSPALRVAPWPAPGCRSSRTWAPRRSPAATAPAAAGSRRPTGSSSGSGPAPPNRRPRPGRRPGRPDPRLGPRRDPAPERRRARGPGRSPGRRQRRPAQADRRAAGRVVRRAAAQAARRRPGDRPAGRRRRPHPPGRRRRQADRRGVAARPGLDPPGAPAPGPGGRHRGAAAGLETRPRTGGSPSSAARIPVRPSRSGPRTRPAWGSRRSFAGPGRRRAGGRRPTAARRINGSTSSGSCIRPAGATGS